MFMGWYYATNYRKAIKKLKRDCDTCKKHGRPSCPNSFYCYSTTNKPFYEPKENT